MLAITSPIPHSEEDIIANFPIRWKMGNINMEYPLFSYRDYMKFRKEMRYLGLELLVQNNNMLPEEALDVISEIHSDNPAMKWFDEIGLPYIIVKHANPTDKKRAFEEINNWSIANPTALPIGWPLNIESLSDEILRIGLAAYMSAMPINTVIEFLNSLLEAQFKIKKKVALTFMVEKPEVEMLLSSDSPLSHGSRVALASKLRKRIKRSLISSSSP